MAALDFKAELTPDGRITVPPELASQVPPGETIQVVLHWGDYDDGWSPEDDKDWKAAVAKTFAKAYHPDDSVYDALAENNPDS